MFTHRGSNSTISNNSVEHKCSFFVYTQLNVTIIFQIIQFSQVHSLNIKQFYLTYRLDPFRCYHSGPEWIWSDTNEEVLCIPQSSSITGATPSDYLVSYKGPSWGILSLCRDAVSVFCIPSLLGFIVDSSS